MLLSIIAAISDNNIIGRNGTLPWRLPADLQHFRKLTTGHSIIMGRRTWDSIGRPLPQRRSIIITRNRHFDAPGAAVVHDLTAAVAHARDAGDSHAFVIGGRAIYELALPLADRLYITRVHAPVQGDVSFPDWKPSDWQLVNKVSDQADDRNEYPWSFTEYQRFS